MPLGIPFVLGRLDLVGPMFLGAVLALRLTGGSLNVYSQIGLITLTFQMVGSILQPVIGFYTDRHPRPYSLVFGMGVTWCGLILLALAPEIAAGYGKIFAYLHDDVHKDFLSVDLATRLIATTRRRRLALLDRPHKISTDVLDLLPRDERSPAHTSIAPGDPSATSHSQPTARVTPPCTAGLFASCAATTPTPLTGFDRAWSHFTLYKNDDNPIQIGRAHV